MQREHGKRPAYVAWYKTQRWRKLRAAVLQREPHCRYCRQAGRTTPSTVCDHAKPHRGDERLFWDERNLVGSCKQCHDGSKQQAEKGDSIMRGADASGAPLDPAHPWHSEG